MLRKVSSFPVNFPRKTGAWKLSKLLIYNGKSAKVSSFPAKRAFRAWDSFAPHARILIFLGKVERKEEKGGFLRLKSFHPYLAGWKHSWKAGNFQVRHHRRAKLEISA